MSQHPSEYQTPWQQPGEPPKHKSWFGRNWKWFVPVAIVLPLLCCCGGPIGLVMFGLSVIFDSTPYNDTLALAAQSAAVQQEIGTPIDAPDGFMDLVQVEQKGGKINTDDTTYFYAELPISGPNGSGWLSIDASSNDGGQSWHYTTQEITVDSTGDAIDLLQGNSHGAGHGAVPHDHDGDGIADH